MKPLRNILIGLRELLRGSSRSHGHRAAGHQFPPLAPRRDRDRHSLREFRQHEEVDAPEEEVGKLVE